MQEYIAFLSDQWFLVVALVVVVVMLVWSYIGPQMRGYTEVSPKDAIRLMNQEDALVLDVRGENEFLDGHIINAINIPVNYLDKRLGELEPHKSRPIVVVCRTGGRASQACSTLRKQGFEKVSALAGGLLAWQHDKYPVSKNKKAK